MQIFLNVMVLLLFLSFADAKVLKLSSIPIPLMVEDANNGLFIQLTKEIAKRNGYELDILVQPPGKALLAFSTNKVQGFFPALDDSVPKVSAKSTPFYYKTDYVFYRKGLPLKTIKDLEGKKVGLTFRYTYSQDLLNNRRVKFEYSPEDVINMKKLARGALDAFVVEERSGQKALQISGVQGVEFDRKAPLSRLKVFYAFQNDDEGRQLAAMFSKTIDEMKKDGSLSRILAETK